MSEPKPQRPWWRKKRWQFAVAVWLMSPVGYVLSSGPAFYARLTGWLSSETYDTVYRPLDPLLPDFFGQTGNFYSPLYYEYVGWWSDRAAEDAPLWCASTGIGEPFEFP